MSRSIWKGPYLNRSIWKNILLIKKKVTNTSDKNISGKTSQQDLLVTLRNNKQQTLKIWNRQSMITPEFIGVKCEIYSGNKWVNLNINEDRIGHLFGEFVPTKKIAQFKRKAKAKKRGK